MKGQNQNSSPCYLLLGPENGQKEEFLANIKKQLQKRLGEQPELHRAYPYKIDMPELVGLLRNRSLFTPHRLVVLREAHDITKKSDFDTLIDYLKQPSETATLVLITDRVQISDKPGVTKRIEALIPKGARVVFWELFENQKRGWIQNYFRSADFSIDSDAVEMILELVENDTADLRRECEMLTHFYDSSHTITESDVEEVLYHSKNENVFTLFDNIVKMDFEACIEVLHALILAGLADPTSLLGGLTWQFRKLVDFQRYKGQNEPDDVIAKKLSIRGKRSLRTYQNGVSNYSILDLERIFVRVVEYDALFRTIRTEIDMCLFELFLYEIVVTKGNRPLFTSESFIR